MSLEALLLILEIGKLSSKLVAKYGIRQSSHEAPLPFWESQYQRRDVSATEVNKEGVGI